MLEYTLIHIEMIKDKKYIHYSGYSYYSEDGTETPYRWVDYTWLMCPLSEAIKYGVSKWEADHQEYVKQYIEDLTETQLNEIFNNSPFPVINANDITNDISLGTYWIK